MGGGEVGRAGERNCKGPLEIPPAPSVAERDGVGDPSLIGEQKKKSFSKTTCAPMEFSSFRDCAAPVRPKGRQIECNFGRPPNPSCTFPAQKEDTSTVFPKKVLN